MPQRFADSVDCCVAGCGPAGAMLGLLLARAGLTVAVFEKHADFLRDFRGDTVHPSTLEVLDDLGLARRFLELPHTEVTRAELSLPGAQLYLDVSHIGARFPFVMFVPQWDFLDFITREAKGYAGFRLHMGCDVDGLVEANGRIAGVKYRDAGGNAREQRATLTVAADGRSSALRDAAGLKVKDLGSAIDVMWFRLPRARLASQPLGAKAARGLILVFFPRYDFWQVAYVIPKGAATAVRRAGITQFKKHIAQVAPELAGAVDTLHHFDQVKLLSVQTNRLERWWRPGFLALGDAAHAMSPVGGVGINLAVQDAVTAANVLCEPLSRGRVEDSDLMYVQHKRMGPTRRTQALQSVIQKSILERAIDDSRPFELPWLARGLLSLPVVRTIAARMMLYGVTRPHVRTPYSPVAAHLTL